MKIKEMNKIINDKNSQELTCNFKIKGKGISKFDLIMDRLDIIDKRLDKIDEFIVEQRQFNQFVLEQFKRQEQFNKAIMVRLDNLVSKNNLKE